MWLAIAHTAAWINLFNLMPIWQLDGGRVFSSLSSGQRWLAVAALAFAWTLTHDGLVLLVLLVAAWRAFATRDAIDPDRGALALFASVAIALAAVFRLTGGVART